jgi:hypothetical protein
VDDVPLARQEVSLVFAVEGEARGARKDKHRCNRPNPPEAWVW